MYKAAQFTSEWALVMKKMTVTVVVIQRLLLRQKLKTNKSVRVGPKPSA